MAHTIGKCAQKVSLHGSPQSGRFFWQTGKMGQIFAASTAVLVTPAIGQTVKRKPPMEKMKEGELLLVDDGSCPAGQIKEVIGGNHVVVGGTKRVERIMRCIPKR